MSDAIGTSPASTPAEHGSEVLLPDVRIRPDSLLRAEHLVKRYGKRPGVAAFVDGKEWWRTDNIVASPCITSSSSIS